MRRSRVGSVFSGLAAAVVWLGLSLAGAAEAQTAPNPAMKNATAAPATYSEQMAHLAARTDVSNAVIPTPAQSRGGQKASASGFVSLDGGTGGAQALSLSLPTTITNPDEIVELVRALKNDPDLIYEYVYNNIETLPQFGSLKGPVGALIDGKGTATDQAELMELLLQQAALSNSAITNPQIQFGQIWLTQAQLHNWLGVDNSQGSVGRLLASGGIPTGLQVDGSGLVTCAKVGWAWLTVQISGTTYVFDPAAKLSKQTLSDLQAEPAGCVAGTLGTEPASYAYNTVSGVNLATAMGYSQTSFVNQAESTGSVSSTAVSGLNRTQTRTNLATYSGNLVTWIKSNAPTASTASVIGGKAIGTLPVGTHQRWPNLPYICNASGSGCSTAAALSCTDPTWLSDANKRVDPCYGTTVPPAFRTTLQVTIPGASAITFNSSDIYGHRLTVFFDGSNAPVLSLDGTVQATGSAVTSGASISIPVAIVHPYQSSFADESGSLTVKSGSQYLISTGWGPVSRGMMEKHRRLLMMNQQANPAQPAAEPVLGESLAMEGYSWLAQLGQAMLMTGQISGSNALYQHAVGIVGIGTVGAGPGTAPYIDLPLNIFAVVQQTGRASTTTPSLTAEEAATFYTFVQIGSVLESGTLEQLQASNTAASTIKLLDMASQTDTIFDIDNTGAGGNSSIPSLISYSTADSNRISSLVNSGMRVIAPQHGNQSVGAWGGTGFLQMSQDYTTLGAIISGGMSGGFLGGAVSNTVVDTWAVQLQPVATVPVTGLSIINPEFTVTGGASATPLELKIGEPVSSFSGAFEYDHQDLTVGSGTFPYALSFSRKYNSSSRLVASTMGRGWTHSLAFTAQAGSDGFAGMGADSPISGASTIAAIYVLQDLMSQANPSPPPGANPSQIGLDRLVIAAQTERWLMDQLTGNIVAVAQPGSTEAFLKLADGSYNRPLNSSATLTLSGGLYTYKTPSGVTLSFNSAGNISTWHSPAGPTVTFNYNGSNQLTSVGSGMGRTLTLTYTPNPTTGTSQVTSVTDGTRTVSYTYDGTDQLTAFHDAASPSDTITYQYDQPGRMTKVFYPSNPTIAFVTNTYSVLERVNVQQDAFGNTTNFYFGGPRTEIDDPAGTPQVYYFGATGKTLASIDGLGHATTNVYDGLDRLVSTTLPEGNSVSYTYDNTYHSGWVSLQNVTGMTTTAKAGSGLAAVSKSLTYDTNCPDQVKTATDANGNALTNFYNATTCTLSETDEPAVTAGTPKTFYTYSSRGQVLTVTDPLGKVTSYTYDTSTEELLTQTDDYGTGRLNLLIQFGYNTVGDVTSVTDPNNNVTTTTYDNLRRVTQVTAPTSTNAITKFTYDADSHVTQVQRQTATVGTWETTSSTWSASGKKLTDTDGNSHTTSYHYDTLDRVDTITDPVSRVTTNTYDVLSRLISVKNTAIQAAPLATYTFTVNGKRATLADANGHTTSYVYDGFDRLTQMQYPQANPSLTTSDAADYEGCNSYDNNANCLIARKRDGTTTITSTFDSLNRPTRVTTPDQDNVYAYDLAGKVTSVTRHSDGQGVAYGYDTAGRLTSETTFGKAMTYQVDANGNRKRTTWADGYYVTYDIDALNRVAAVRENGAASGVGVLATYGYDPLSRRVTLTRGNGAVTSYVYDPGDRLTSQSLALLAAVSANNLALTFAYTNANQLLTRSSDNGAYGWTNHATATVNTTPDGLNRDAAVVTASGYDANGDMTKDAAGGRTFSYDKENRLRGGAVSATATSVTLSYDPLGRLNSQATTVSGATTNTTFLYDGQRLSAEYDGSGNLLRRYIQGPGSDEPVVWIEGGATSTDRRWLHTDERGSVVAQSDNTGTVTQIYAYGPYGEPRDGFGSGSRFRYTGQIAIPELAVYHYKARAYDPAPGRFLQTDPSGYDGGINLYAYVNDDPTDLVDSSGRAPARNPLAMPATVASAPQTINVSQFQSAFNDIWTTSLQTDPNGNTKEDGVTGATHNSTGQMYLFAPGGISSTQGSFVANLNVGVGNTAVFTMHTHQYGENEGGFTGISFDGGDIGALIQQPITTSFVQSGAASQFALMKTGESPTSMTSVDKGALYAETTALVNDLTQGTQKYSFAQAEDIVAQNYAAAYGMAYYHGSGGVFTKCVP